MSKGDGRLFLIWSRNEGLDVHVVVGILHLVLMRARVIWMAPIHCANGRFVLSEPCFFVCRGRIAKFWACLYRGARSPLVMA